jgi:hypothetical protein
MADAQQVQRVSRLSAIRTPALENVAWAWTDFVERSGIPFLVPAALLFGFMYGTSALIALAFGDLEAFAEDVRRPASYLISASYFPVPGIPATHGP